MQVKDKRIFEQATLSMDKDQRNLSVNEYPYIENCTDLVYNNATLTALTNIQSNKLVEYDLSSKGTNTVLGSFEWKEKETLIYFVHNSVDGHSILSYDNKTKVVTPILKNELVLNFDINYPVNSASVLDNMLMWTDNYNEPRSILIDKAIKYTASTRYSISNIQSATLMGVNWTKLSLNTINGLSIGTKIYVKQSSDNYYNGIATILEVGLNYVVIDKGYLNNSSYGYFYIYSGNKQYYEITEQMIRFIKRPPVTPPNTSYNTKIAEGEKHTLILSDFTYDYNLSYIRFEFTSVLSGNGISIKFSKIPHIGEYNLTTDLEYIGSTIANVLSNSLFPETIYENGILKIYSNTQLPDVELIISSAGGLQYELNGTFSDDSFTVSPTQQSVIVIKSPLSPIAYQKSNSLRGRYFNVFYRWKYDDKSYSVFSSCAKSVLPVGDITVEGRYTENEYLNNILNISLNIGTDEVEQIEIAITTNEVPDAPYIIERIYKYDNDGNHVLKNKHEKYKSDDTYTTEFNNTNYGINVSDTEVKRLFDNVPLKAKALSVLDTRNAVFSNYVDGYDNVLIKAKSGVITEKQISYPTNSLAITEIPSIITTNWVIAINANNTLIKDILFSFDISIVGGVNGVQKTFSNKVRYLTKENDTLAIIYNSLENSIRSFLDGCQANGMTTASSGIDIITTTNGIILAPYQPIYTTVYDLNLINPSSISSYTVTSYKSGATHKFAVRYYDKSGRCGADNEAVSVYVNTATENVLTSLEQENQYVKNKIKLQLYNKPPSWADRFEITYSKSNIESFVQYYGAINYVLDLYHFTLPKEIIDLQSEYPKVRENLSAYTYTKGDRLRIISFMPTSDITYNGLTYVTNTTYYLPEYFDVELFGWDETLKQVVFLDRLPIILSTSDNYKNMLVKAEIYSIKKERADAESGELYNSTGYNFNVDNGFHEGNINNQTATQPAEILLDSGDIFVRNRLPNKAQSTSGISMIIESDNGNDFFKSQNIWYSKPSLVLQDAKQKLFKSHYRWGGNFIEGSDTSYLKRFLGSDYSNIPETNGAITETIQRGQTLKLIQENKVYSQYIGVSEIADQSGSTSLIKTDRLFGGKRPSDFEYGTKYQKSVVKTPRAIYFVDLQNSAIIADAGNELQDITIGRVKTFMNYINLQFANSKSNTIHTVYDQQTQNVLFTFVWTDEVLDQLPIPEGETPEYSRTNVKRTKTLIWNEAYMQFKGFIDLCKNKVISDNGAYSPNNTYPINSISCIGDTYASFIGSELWVQDITSRLNLFGEQKKMIISVPSNVGKEKEMVFDSVEIHTNNIKINSTTPNKNWRATIKTLPDGISPNGQLSYINSQLFVQKESLLTASILRDVNTRMSGSEMYKLHNGDVIRGESCLVTLENESDEAVNIYSVIIKETPSEMSV